MKIVCGSCGAKYSIADEKVQGKVFKIRCKKCSNVIVVKGNEDGDETVSAGAGAAPAAEWYVVIDGEQAGPMTPSEIESHFMAGRVSAESFAWRDGLADWVPLSSLDDFSHLANDRAGAGPEEATQISDDYSHYQKKVNEEADETSVMSAPSGFGAASSFSSFDSEPDNGNFSSGFSDFGGSGGDDYGYAAAGGGADSAYDSGGLFSSFDSPSSGPAIQSASGGGGMFASFDSGSSSNDDFLGLSSNEPMPTRSKSTAGGLGAGLAAAPVASDLVGKRNENSVLFSLSSLDQVSGVGGGGSKSPEPAADVPVTDGSGLIDIRALASAHKSMKSSGPASFDDSPSVDPFTTGTMAMPALMPMGSHRSNKPLIIGGAIGGLVLLGVIGALGYVVMTKNDQPQTVTERVIIQEKIVQAANPEADAKAAAEAAAAEKQALEAGAEPAAAEPAAADAETKKTTTARKTTSDTKAAAATEAPKEEPKEEAKAAPKDSIDRLLNTIDEGEKPAAKKETKKETTTASSSGAKDKLDKSDVLNTIKAYVGRVNTCQKTQNTNNLTGTMKVKFLIKPNGSVTNVEVASGEFAGTDVGRCVVKAVSGMRFPATTAKDNVPVTYPFKL